MTSSFSFRVANLDLESTFAGLRARNNSLFAERGLFYYEFASFILKYRPIYHNDILAVKIPSDLLRASVKRFVGACARV